MTNRIRILIADDHAMVRMGLRVLLETEPDLEVVGEAKNGEAAVAEALRLRPDVVVMDLMMPRMDGIEATRELAARAPDAKVLLLTTFSTSDGLAEALAAGARGAFMKSVEDTALIAAIRKVAAGETAVAPDVRRLIREDPPAAKLTPRQRDILASITRGLTNKEIAAQLGIRADGVNLHIMEILSKLGASNRTEAVAIALRKHLLKL